MRNAATLLHVGRLHPSPRWRIADQRHAYHELIVPVRGRMTLLCPTGRFDIGPGDILLYPAGMPHTEESVPSDPVESFFFSLSGPIVRGRMLRRRHDHSGRMRQLARWLYAGQFGKDAQARAEQAALLQALLIRFFREDQGPEPELAQAVRAYVRNHLDEPLTLDRLAKEVRLSRHYFVRTYHRLTGQPPMKDVRRLRLEYARDLVITTKLPLKEIAIKAGLGSPYAFSRLFHRAFDMPPGEFRRSLHDPD